MKSISNYAVGINISKGNSMMTALYQYSVLFEADAQGSLTASLGYKRPDQIEDTLAVILLDCCPPLGMLTINVFAAADAVLIPMQAHYFSIKGIEQLFILYQM